MRTCGLVIGPGVRFWWAGLAGANRRQVDSAHAWSCLSDAKRNWLSGLGPHGSQQFFQIGEKTA